MVNYEGVRAKNQQVEQSQNETTGRYKPYGVVYEDNGVTKYQKIRGEAFEGRIETGDNLPQNGQCPGDRALYNGRCLDKCSPGWLRNPSTNRCFKIRAVRRRRMTCRDDHDLNITGRCVKRDAVRRQLVPCGPNRYRSSVTMRCRSGVPPADPGLVYEGNVAKGGIIGPRPQGYGEDHGVYKLRVDNGLSNLGEDEVQYEVDFEEDEDLQQAIQDVDDVLDPADIDALLPEQIQPVDIQGLDGDEAAGAGDEADIDIDALFPEIQEIGDDELQEALQDVGDVLDFDQ